MKDFRGQLRCPLKQAAAGEHRNIGRLLVAVRSLKRERRFARVASDQVDHPAEGISAVKTRGASLNYFDPLDCLTRNSTPEDPTTERIIDRNAIGKHHRATRAAGA